MLKLRPHQSVPQEDRITDNLQVRGNFILDISRTEDIFNICIKEHMQMSPMCKGFVRLDNDKCCQMGFGIRSHLHCSECQYQSSGGMKFFEEIEDSNIKGHTSPKINVQMQVALTKEPIGNSALRNIFALCDINPPAESGMQKLANKVNNKILEINAEQLSSNRKHIKRIMKCRHDGVDIPITIEADTAYNNPIKVAVLCPTWNSVMVPCVLLREGP